MKKFLLLFMAISLSFNISSEIRYKVSGKVLQNDQPASNFKVVIKDKENYKPISSIPDKNGNYYFYLLSGDYKIRCERISQPKNYNEINVLVIGPSEIRVQNKNIKAINFKIYKYTDVIEKNINILSNIPQNTSVVNYKWGKVPLHTEEKCREFAEEFKSDVIDEMPSDIVPYLHIGEPVIYYDFKNNPIFYEYPVVYSILNVEVGYFGVKALGIEPDFGRDIIALEIESKSDPKLLEYRKMGHITSNGLIPRIINEITLEKNLNSTSLKVVKLIYNGYSTDMLLKIKSSNELILASFSSLTWESVNSDDLQFIQDAIELDNTLEYIVDFKSKNGFPIIE